MRKFIKKNRSFLLIISIVTIAICINIVTFRAMDEGKRHNYKALHRYHTASLIEIGIMTSNSSRRDVAPLHFFRENFRGAQVVLPTRRFRGNHRRDTFSGSALLGLGGAGSAIWCNYNVAEALIDNPVEFDLTAQFFNRPSRNFIRRHFAIYATDQNSPAFFVVRDSNNRTAFADINNIRPEVVEMCGVQSNA